ncbi:MAG TPA: hypothetical protein VLD18_09080, partial [Verrucomicrobiae bacterium]|nr:hypothetical protein [Verrucomicrobiae bacterium]
MTSDIQIMDSTQLPPLLTEDSVAPVVATAAASRWRRVVRAIGSGLDWAFGLISLIVGLALLSIVPFLNFLSLGYLIHASGHVAVTGKLRSGFVGIRKASILGSFFLGAWLVSLPVRIVSSLWKDAE